MVEIWLPYGSSEIPARVPEERLVQIFQTEAKGKVSDPEVETKRLISSNSDLLKTAKKARRICVTLGESSNASLATMTTKVLIETLRSEGIQLSAIELLRTVEAPDLDSNLFGGIRITSHDPSSSELVPTKVPNLEFPVAVNSTFARADFRIIVGELRPHHLLGYGGLCDTVFPGLASRESRLAQVSNRKGIVVSDLRRERIELTDSFGDVFSLGFVLEPDLSPSGFIIGNFRDSLKDLEKMVLDVCSVRVDRTSDVLVMSAGGKPWDESLLSAVESLPAGLSALKKEGVLIIAAECPLGHGTTEFYEWCTEHKEPRYLEARLRHSFNYQGFKATYLSRTLERHRIYLVSTIPDHYVQNVFGMRAAATVNSALASVQHSLGSSSSISVMPNAARVILTQSTSSATKSVHN